MKRITAALLLILGCIAAAPLPAADSRIYATITINTNPATGSNLVVNTDTRSWTTNVTDATAQIAVAADIPSAQTNLFNHLANYPIAGSMVLWGASTNDVKLMAQVNSNLTVTFGGTWGSVTYTTNYIERSYTVSVPYTAVTNLPYRTNIASGLVEWISQATTSTVPVTATAFAGFVNTNETQTINGAKTFTTSINGTLGAVSNGVWVSGTTTNLTNYGAAFVSAGTGADSLQLGAAATASGATSTAVGVSANAGADGAVALGQASIATNGSAVAVGNAAWAKGDGSVAIGQTAATRANSSVAIGYLTTSEGGNATAVGTAALGTGNGSSAYGSGAIAGGLSSIAIGSGAEANFTNSIAVGTGAVVNHNNSVAIGTGVLSTKSNQIVLGDTTHVVAVPGLIESATGTNTALVGSNYIAGSWTTATTALEPMDGANAMEISATEVITFTGGSLSSGIWTLDGLYPGWTGRKLRLINLTGYASTLEHNSGLTAATNQFNCPISSDLTWSDGYAIDVLYESGKWRVLPSASVPTTVGDLTVTGNITLTNTVYDDCTVSLDARSGPAGAAPTFAAFAGPVFAWEFSGSSSNALYFSLQLPHSYKHGSDLLPHLHWTKTTGTANDVIWGLDYVMTSISSNFSSTATTIYMTNTCPTSLQHTISSFPTIAGSNFTASAVMMGKIYRLGDVDADTGTAWGLMFDVHFQADKLGSDSETP